MLPDNEGVVGQVGNIGAAMFLVILVKQEPSHVCVPYYSVKYQ